MMRRLMTVATALALFAGPALAQVEAQATPAPAADTTAPAANPKPSHHRQTLRQRFDTANTAHDGHLTKDQAAAANWPYVVNNFAAIDKDGKGYVTVDDIHAFAHARHASHAASHRQSLQQRFDAANTTHDGHLTKDQAAAAHWGYVASNFAAIDNGGKGYVTVADIHAFAHARYLARHKAAPATPAAAAAPAAPSAPAATTN